MRYFMKHQKRIRVIAVTLAVALTLGISVFAAGYDSSEDPLISLSYLTNIFKPEIEKAYKEKVAGLESTVASLENKIAALEQKVSNAGTTPPSAETEPSADSSSALYEVIELTTGDQLYAVSACEIILRAGEAYCIAPDPTQGLAALTGYEVLNGQALAKNINHLIPRGDGRGIMANSQSVFIMVRGEYKIVEG